MRPPLDERAVFERAYDSATVDAARAAAEIRRMVRSGAPWDSPALVLVRDKFGRAKREQAIARALVDMLGGE